MKVLGISGDEQKAFWLVLAAIYHLGSAGATKGETASAAPVQLLNISVLSARVFSLTLPTQQSLRRWSRRHLAVSVSDVRRLQSSPINYACALKGAHRLYERSAALICRSK